MSVAWLSERFRSVRSQLKLVHTSSGVMAGDIFTKAFPQPLRWTIAQQLISVFDPSKMREWDTHLLQVGLKSGWGKSKL